LWDAQRIAANRRVDRTFEPQVSNDNREARFLHWRRACGIDER
jgi:glycerol kinase